MHHQKRVAVHLLIVFGAHIDGKSELAHGGIHIHGHGLRGRAGHTRFLAGLPVAAAILAKAARVHEQQKGAFAAGQEYLPLQFDQLGVDLARPGMTVCGIVHGALEVHDDRIAIFAEKALTFSH